MQLLNERGYHIVDTTCPGSPRYGTPWKHRSRHSHQSSTAGRLEETLATSSFAGTYLVVLDLEEAQIVADYILGKEETEQLHG